MENKQLVTVAHLKSFKEELLSKIRLLLKSNHRGTEKKWLKSREVRKLLNVCPGTLQTMRKQKTIPFQKVGGTIYYDQEKIHEMLEKSNTDRHAL